MSHLEQAGQIQTQQREQGGQRRHGPGILELESPAELLPRGAQGQQSASEQHEAQNDSRRIGQSAQALLACIVGVAAQRQDLDRQHGKDTGHQIQNQPPQQRGPECQPPSRPQSTFGRALRRGCGLLCRLQGSLQGRRHLGPRLGRRRPGPLHRSHQPQRRHLCRIARDAIRIRLAPQGEHDRQGAGAVGALGLVERQRHPPGAPRPSLLARIGRGRDGGCFGIQVERLALPGSRQALHLVAQRMRRGIDTGMGAGRLGSGQCLNRYPGQGRLEGRARGGLRLSCRQRETELPLLRNAFLAAYQPLCLQPESDGGSRFPCRAYMHRHRQQHGAVVTVVGQLSNRQPGGHRPAHVAGSHAGRQRPAQGGGLSTVTGIAPIGVPVRLMGELQPHPQRLACGHPLRGIGQQACIHLVIAHLAGVRRQSSKGRRRRGAHAARYLLSLERCTRHAGPQGQGHPCAVPAPCLLCQRSRHAALWQGPHHAPTTDPHPAGHGSGESPDCLLHTCILYGPAPSRPGRPASMPMAGLAGCLCGSALCAGG